MPKAKKSSSSAPGDNEKASFIARLTTNDALAEPSRWWLVGFLALATLALAYPVFGGAFLVNPNSDQYIAGYGFREFAAQSLQSGSGFPQWNPYLFGGLPYVAAMHGDIFYPTFLLRLIMPTDLAMTCGFIIHTFLAGALTMGFLRSVGMSRWTAAFGGAAYLLCGPIASYASPGHDGKLFVSALLPLSLWMLTRAIKHSAGWAWGVFAISVGLAVLSPHPQLLQYFLLVNGAYALLLALTVERVATVVQHAVVRRVDVSAQWKPIAVLLGKALGMVLLGMGIGAIQYWPVMGYVNSSPRANGREFEFASQFSFPPEELVNVYLPQFSGILEQYWGRNGIHLHSEYLGIVVLMLAPLAFGIGSRKLFARFWLGTAIVSLLWALGGFTPFFKLVYWIVPGTKYFRAPSTIIYVLAFSMCVLASLGLERLLERRVSARNLKRYLAGWITFGTMIALFAWTDAIGRIVSNFATRLMQRSPVQRLGMEEVIERVNHGIVVGATRSLAVVLIAALLIWLFTHRKIKPTLFAALLLVLSSVDMWSIARRYWMFWNPASELFASDEIIRYLQNQKEPGRVFVYTRTGDHRTTYDPYFGGDGFGRSAGFMPHGIRSVTGYQGNVLARYEAMSADAALIEPRFWQHENVRWLYTNEPIADSVFTRINGPLQNAGGSVSYLYELPGNNSYSWVAASYGAVDDSTALRDLRNGRDDPRAFVAVDTAATVNGERIPRKTALLPPPSSITTRVLSFGAGFANIELSAPTTEGNALVVSENYYPGWRATVDGKSVPVVRAGFNLVGVLLPAGARKVAIEFRDPRYNTGRAVTLASLAICVLLVARTRKRAAEYSGTNAGSLELDS